MKANIIIGLFFIFIGLISILSNYFFNKKINDNAKYKNLKKRKMISGYVFLMLGILWVIGFLK